MSARIDGVAWTATSVSSYVRNSVLNVTGTNVAFTVGLAVATQGPPTTIVAPNTATLGLLQEMIGPFFQSWQADVNGGSGSVTFTLSGNAASGTFTFVLAPRIATGFRELTNGVFNVRF